MVPSGRRVREYLQIEAQLLAWRSDHPEDTPEEEAMLDEMDRAWWGMSEPEREEVESRRARAGK
jgi:hypothetical protein